MGSPSRMYFKVATIFILVSPLAVIGYGDYENYEYLDRPAPRGPSPRYEDNENYRLSPEDYVPIGPPSNDQLNYEDIDSNIARRKTKKAERFLKGIFDWIGGIFTGHYSKNKI